MSYGLVISQLISPPSVRVSSPIKSASPAFRGVYANDVAISMGELGKASS